MNIIKGILLLVALLFLPFPKSNGEERYNGYDI